MKRFLLFAVSLLTANFVCADDYLVSLQTWYGDNMGATSETTATKRMEYFYDAQNRLVRRIQTGLLENGTDWQLTNYYLSHYDAAGHLSMTNSLQYGIYDQNQYALKATNDTVDYKYDANGLLLEENNRAKKTRTEYSYNADGQVVKAEIYKSGKLSQTLTYSDFTKGGAQKVTSESSSSYNCYEGTFTYDGEGNKTSELRHDTQGVLTFAEYWTYENGVLSLYEKKGISAGKEVDSQKTVYEVVDDNITRQKSYTYSNGEWKMKGGSTIDTEMNYFDGERDVCQLKEAKADVSNSSVTLSFTMPEGFVAVDMMVVFNIYRDGLLLETLPNVDKVDYQYVDKDVPNGDHEYFIQTVINDRGSNISNIVTASLSREYPHATGLHATTARKSTEGSYMVKLAWTNPEVSDDMQFVNNNVMKVGKYYSTPMLEDAEAITDLATTSVEVNFGIDAVQTVYLQTRYQGGVVSSDTITVDATKFMGKVSEDNRMLQIVETWGDAQGHDSGITKKEITFYGKDNRVQRVGRYSKTLGTDGSNPADWTIYEYTTYLYGESGMLEKEYTQQYGRYDHGGMGFRAAQDTTFYDFNLEGQKLRQSNRMGYTEYEYTADGSLAKEHTVEYAVPDNFEQTITYSDFAGRDKPRLTVSTGTRSSQQWMLETEYDERGNKESERKSSYKSSTQTYSPSQLQEFYYNEAGELTSDTVFTIKLVNDVEQYSYKSYTDYTPEAQNANRVTVVKRVWDSILKKFGNPKTYNVYEYADINAEKYAPTVEVEYADGGVNSMILKVDVPEAQRSAMTAFNVYRNGVEIGHAIPYFDAEHYVTDEFGLNGEWCFYQSEVPNGQYDYYVEMVQLDATMKGIAKRHNISNILDVDFLYQMPAPTRLREVSRRVTTTENTEENVIETNIFVQLEWDAPAFAEDDYRSYIGSTAADYLQAYEVMTVGSQVADNYDAEDKLQNSYEFALRGLSQVEVYVDAIYPIGRFSSNHITIDAASTDITNVHVSLTDTTSGRTYNLRGQQVGRDVRGVVIRNGKKTIMNK